jgi:hypothetical protein
MRVPSPDVPAQNSDGNADCSPEKKRLASLPLPSCGTNDGDCKGTKHKGRTKNLDILRLNAGKCTVTKEPKVFPYDENAFPDKEARQKLDYSHDSECFQFSHGQLCSLAAVQ